MLIYARWHGSCGSPDLNRYCVSLRCYLHLSTSTIINDIKRCSSSTIFMFVALLSSLQCDKYVSPCITVSTIYNSTRHHPHQSPFVRLCRRPINVRHPAGPTNHRETHPTGHQSVLNPLLPQQITMKSLFTCTNQRSSWHCFTQSRSDPPPVSTNQRPSCVCFDQSPCRQVGQFPELFADLEKQQEALDIQSFGVSLTTLEEVCGSYDYLGVAISLSDPLPGWVGHLAISPPPLTHTVS